MKVLKAEKMSVSGPSVNIDIQEEDDETKTTAQHKHPQKTRQSGRYRTVGMVLGLLCGVQALLNIGLRLSLYSDMTKEKDNLVKDLDELRSSFDRLQSRYNALVERDDLKRRLCESYGFKFGDGGVCYYISTEERNWTESRQYCRDNHSDLLVINSKEKQDFVQRLDRTLWLGLTDRSREGSFQWVDGTPLTSPTYWYTGQPDDLDNEDCVEFYNKADRGWNDRSCNEYNHWICERIVY